MPLKIPADHSSVFVRRDAFERCSVTRSQIDSRFNLTDEEFRLEGDLIVIGPLPTDDDLTALVNYFESVGLEYFDDFFELSGNWPGWLGVFAQAERKASR
jgi:hypothetical protein